MENRIPRPGEKYIHFKNKPYQIIAVASHSETGEKMVVYQALYGDFQCYVRPLEMFVSEVDHVKYPDVKQKYRFELADNIKEARFVGTQETEEEPELPLRGMDVLDLSREDDVNGQEREEEADPLLLQFLDTDTFAEKLVILHQLKGMMTDRLIDDFSTVLDIVIDPGELGQRYHQLETCIKTFARYENDRLR